MSEITFFPLRIRYTEGDKEETIVHDPSEIQSGRQFIVLETNWNPPNPISKYRELAGQIVYKLLANGESDFNNVKQYWINEYTDVLYTLYPDADNHQRMLTEEVDDILQTGIIVRFNINGSIDEEVDDLYIIEEVDG